MTFDEWEQVKAAVAHRDSTQMQLNQLPASGGSGGGARGDLTVHDNELGALGNIAHELRGRLSTDGDHARQTTFDASVQLFNDGLETGSGLTELHDAWSTQLGTLKEACAHISNHLDYSRSAHNKDENKIATEMRNAGGERMTVSRISDYLK
ncbi:MAG: hypothetical protein ACRDP3_13840 [Streptomyces sp.]|uniref:hypothetical protein n=1 Tax=Streptomyces sp. TaxID=1931 RepID=UPI003D6C0338